MRQNIVARKFSPHIGLFEELSEGKHSSTLGDKFLLPPFTVLNAREGWWQDRKRAWLELGIKSELGRGGDEASASFKQQQQHTDFQRNRKPPPHETTLGAIAPNEKTIMGRTGTYAPGAYNKAAPGGAARPAMNYKNRERGTGSGKAIPGSEAGGGR